MKLYKYCFAFWLLQQSQEGCKNEDINKEHHYDNKLMLARLLFQMIC